MAERDEATVTFFSGTSTIGGVQALVRLGSSGVLFDFGNTPNPAGALFSRASPPPGSGGLAAHLRAGMAPLVEGLYDPAQLAPDGGSVASACAPMREPGRLLDGAPVHTDLDALAVFVSHAHNDHCGLLPFVGPDVPVVMSADGGALHAGLVDVGALPAVSARVHGLREGERFAAGDLQLELVHVDHDVPGSAGFVLTAGDRRLAWTGDWRAHGHQPHLMRAFAERAAGVDLLITEGTTLRPDASPVRPLSEAEVIQRVDGLLAGTEGLVFVTPYARNLRRLAALRDVATAHDRQLVLRPETLSAWRSAVDHGLTDLDPDGAGKPVAVLDVGGERTVQGVAVGPADLRQDRRAFLVELQVPDRWLALAVGAGPGDLLVHSNGEPLGPWAAAEWGSLSGWVRTLGMDFAWLDSGGHATPDDLAWLVDAVQPGAVAAVHSAHPELFPRTTAPLVLPRPGLAMTLAAPGPVARGTRGADPSRTVYACASS